MLFGAGKIQIVMQQLPLSVATVADFYRFGQILIGRKYASASQRIADNLALQRVGEHGSFVGERAAPILIASDRGKFPVRMIESFYDLRRVWNKKFFPYRTFILIGGSIAVRCEPHRFGEIRELLVM